MQKEEEILALLEAEQEEQTGTPPLTEEEADVKVKETFAQWGIQYK